MTEPERPLLQMRGIVKEFPGVRALDGVDLDVRRRRGALPARPERRRQVHPDQGARRRAPARRGRRSPGRARRSRSATPQAADAPGHRHDLPGARPGRRARPSPRTSSSATSRRRPGSRRPRAARTRRARAARPARPPRDPAAPRGRAGCPPPAADRSMARALSHDARLIVMDEPSAVLDPRRGRQPVPGDPRPDRRGRRGRLHLAPARGDPHDRRPGHRAQGRPHRRHRAARAATRRPREVIRADDRPHDRVRLPARGRRRGRRGDAAARGRGPRPARASSPTSTSSVRAGEIVGLAGLVGSGRSEILETVYGARRADRRARCASTGKRAAARVACRPRCAPGSGLAPEERKSQALLLGEPVYRNITLADAAPLRPRAACSTGGAERAAAARARPSRSTCAPPTPTAPVRTLSGGNQQKVVLGPLAARAAAGCCCSTSRPAASTSAPAPRSTR